ncbi:MAG: DUF1800 domain-containing protein, partial [Chloroflexi bacterium]|nr:DUF1800 domain-containing protein [Chloroflexota bacterium]
VIFLSEEFATAPPKLKRPYTFVASALRALNSDISNYRVFIVWLELMGQLPYHWAPPNGYPDVSAAWMSNLLPRWNFCLALLGQEFRGNDVPLNRLLEAGQATTTNEALELLAGLIFGRALDDESRTLFAGYVGDGRLADRETNLRLREAVALMLASPAFQWM